MKKRLTLIEIMSGKKATIYSLMDDEKGKTLFEIFVEENQNSFKSEIKDIMSRLKTIINKTGSRENFFKLREGRPGDGVAALYDIPAKKLRLYCIRYLKTILILGGGGPKNVRALQEDPKLHYEQSIMVEVAKQLNERIKNQEICYINNDKNFEAERLESFVFEINIRT